MVVILLAKEEGSIDHRLLFPKIFHFKLRVIYFRISTNSPLILQTKAKKLEKNNKLVIFIT